MKTKLLVLLVLFLFPLRASSIIIYSQPPLQDGTMFQSSWWDPNGGDFDRYVWDKFTLQNAQSINEIRWRGGFDPAKAGSGGPVIDFSVAIYASITGGSQPDVTQPPLVQYMAGGDAGQTLVGTFGGVPMFDYHFVLPAPFQASAGTPYWVQIEAYQHGTPDWGITTGSGGDGSHFLRYSVVGDIHYQIVAGDAAFTLLTPAAYLVYLPSIVR